MVIGFDAKRAFRNNTGLGNYSRMLICGLAERHRDTNLILYAPQMSGYYKSFFSCYANLSTRQPRGWRALFPSLWRGWGVSRHLTPDGVTIYHGLSHELPHLMPKDIKRVVTIHDLVAWRNPEYLGSMEAWMHRLKIRHSCESADVIVAISEQTKRDLIDFLHVPESKIRVLYQSCDEIFWQPCDDDERAAVREKYQLPERFIVSVGTIEQRKNQMALVEAMDHLPSDVHLLLLGRKRGSYGKKVAEAIVRQGFSQRIHIIENASFEDFPAIYGCAVAAAYMSHFEGFGIPILEAMCSYVPVLTSNCSSMPEVGGDAVLYANPDSSDEIAAQLNRLVGDSQLRAELVEKADKRKQLFSTEVIVDQFYKLYNEIEEEMNG